MQQKFHFIITKYCPMEQIFDGVMTFTEAHKFMDEHASYERRVGYKIFNDYLRKWQDFKDSYHGGRKVYDNKGYLYILDPDYHTMKKPEGQAFHLWLVRNDETRKFVQSFSTKKQADKWGAFLTSDLEEGTYIVKPSDINIKDYEI